MSDVGFAQDFWFLPENASATVVEEFSSLACQEVHKSEITQNVLNSRYNQRVDVSGNVIQIRNFECEIKTGPKKPKKPPTLRELFGCDGDEGHYHVKKPHEKRELSQEDKAENAKKNGRRALTNILRTINSNFGMMSRQNSPGHKSIKFFTGTDVSERDLDAFYKKVIRFVDRLEYHLCEKVQYIAVPELQDRGVWHVHVIFYCSFISLQWLKENWSVEHGEGSFQINRVNQVKDVGRYVGKYVGKTFEQSAVAVGRHRFWKSRGLKDLTKQLKANVIDLSTLKRTKRGMSNSDLLEFFEEVTVKMRSSTYSGTWTGEIEFVEIVLQPNKKTEYLIRTLFDVWGGMGRITTTG